jgi:hypothetical protein
LLANVNAVGILRNQSIGGHNRRLTDGGLVLRTVIVGGACAVSLIVGAVQADDRYLATCEPTRQAELERQPPETLPLAA